MWAGSWLPAFLRSLFIFHETDESCEALLGGPPLAVTCFWPVYIVVEDSRWPCPPIPCPPPGWSDPWGPLRLMQF